MVSSFFYFAFLVAVASAEAWTFKEFMTGTWDLERQSSSGIEHAHYELSVVGSELEGSYYEDGEDGSRSNEMVVRIIFDDANSGQFQLARQLPAPEPASTEEPPEPQPAPVPKTAFEFDFHAQNDGRFHISQSKWLGPKGGMVQFIAEDDTFVFSKVGCTDLKDSQKDSPVCSNTITAWSAVRRGAPRHRVAPAAPRSMLQRYGWYALLAIIYFGYKAAKEKAAEAIAKGGKKAK